MSLSWSFVDIEGEDECVESRDDRRGQHGYAQGDIGRVDELPLEDDGISMGCVVYEVEGGEYENEKYIFAYSASLLYLPLVVTRSL